MLNIIENKARSENRSIEIDAQYFEYSKAANPIAAKIISRIPYRNFPASIYAEARTQVIPLDLSLELGCAVPATGPGLLASFVRIIAGEKFLCLHSAHHKFFMSFAVMEKQFKDKIIFLLLPVPFLHYQEVSQQR